LKPFSPKFVAGLTTVQIEDISGEELGMKRKRAKSEKKVELLKEGMRILR
jgi:hypothetical protein